MSSIADRMKSNYELRSRNKLTRRVPVIIRVDGRAFHTYTRDMIRPFDDYLIRSMVLAAQEVAREMQGFKVGYVQSDEASFFLTDYDTLQTDAWFDYVQSKLESISASIMTASFNRSMMKGAFGDAHFDARAFNIPKEEVCNYFLWRAKDWERNSLSMYCRSIFSHKQMEGKSSTDQHEMLHSVGKNWTTDLTARERNGTFIFADGSVSSEITPDYLSISKVLDPLINCEGKSNDR